MKSIKTRRAENEKLLERLTFFSEKVIIISQKLPRTLANIELLKQLIPSATSMGANYNEACEAESSRDFVHKIQICKKEARETKYWLRLLQSVKENLPFVEELKQLHDESDEYLRIFSTIVAKFKNHDTKRH